MAQGAAGFGVYTSELENAANQFRAAAEQVHKALDKFIQDTNIDLAAFGRLPISDEMRAHFKKFRESVISTTETLASHLDGDTGSRPGAAKKLASGAQTYRAADAASTVHVRYRTG